MIVKSKRSMLGLDRQESGRLAVGVLADAQEEQVVGQRGPASCSLLTTTVEPMHPNTLIPLPHLERLIHFSNAAIATKVF